MEIPILQDIAIIFGLSILVLFVCDKIKVPPIIGFLITGAIVGPYGFHLIKSEHEVEILAEIGIVLLMFSIGLELSIKELVHNKKAVLLGGGLQVFLTILVVFGIEQFFGFSVSQSIFIGCLVALSSTAIVLEILQNQGQIHSSHGKTAVAILIFQDIIMVVMILMIPILQPNNDLNIAQELAILAGKAFVIIALVIGTARYVIPPLLFQIAKLRNQELFLLSIVGICLLIAWGSSEVGLSLGLGAFLAGLIISESEYSIRALGSILPFRSVFLSFFFVSVGTLFNINFLIDHFATILLLVLGAILIKAIILFTVSMVIRVSLHTGVLVALYLSQIGEFSFLLSKLGVNQGLLDSLMYQYFLSVTILTMACTPVLIFIAPKLAALLIKILYKINLYQPDKTKNQTVSDLTHTKMEYHLIIIGFGLHGKLLAKTARELAIPYLIIEMDAEIVKEETQRGEPIIYGDATHRHLLEHTYIQNAFLVVLAIADLRISRQIVELIRKMNEKVHIIAKTRFVLEVEHLKELGANSVIPVEFEAALEIQKQMMIHFLIPHEEIERFMDRVREDGYRRYIKEAITQQFDQNEIDKMFPTHAK